MSDAQRVIEQNAAAHDVVAASYDAKHVEIYNPIEQERLAKTVADLVARCGRDSAAALDVGAGTGNLTLKLLQARCRVHAADVSQKSLDRLKAKVPGAPLATSLITTDRLPFPDASFDIVGTYSVLHHIPDYLSAVREMVRVLRPGGWLYIDHESSERSWRPDAALQRYRELTRLRMHEHAWYLLHTGEAFTPAFIKTLFMKAFVNRRYEREGDVHVWPDDHIEWAKVEQVLEASGARIVETREYLHYRPRGGEALYREYKDRCTDMQCVFVRKD